MLTFCIDWLADMLLAYPLEWAMFGMEGAIIWLRRRLCWPKREMPQFENTVIKKYIKYLTIHNLLLLGVQLLMLRIVCGLLSTIGVCKIGGNWTAWLGHRWLMRIGLGWRHHL